MAGPQDALLWSRLWPSEAPAALTEALAKHAARRLLRHGEWLYAKGDAAAGLIGVRRGMIRNVHLAADGRELLFGLFPAGSWFGEVSLFDEAPRPLHAIAEGETEVLVVPAAASLNTAASPLVNVVAVEGGMSQLAVVPTFQVPLAVPDARPFH